MNQEWREQIDEALKRYLSEPDMPYQRLVQAMRYGTEGSGKRLRAILVLEFCRMAGGAPEKAMAFACAVEMIHCYSLIHDDLPCMDDDDLRRGKPSCHKQFDEPTALLAGDALLTKAFEVMSQAELPAEKVVQAMRVLAQCAGADGMAGGQMLDLLNEKSQPAASILELTYSLKTAALLQAACVMGVIAGGGDTRMLSAARTYAARMGVAFQIVDDILDVEGDATLLGKPLGSDAENGKTTFVTLYGLKQAKEMAAGYSKEALAALAELPEHDSLYALTESLLVRRS